MSGDGGLVVKDMIDGMMMPAGSTTTTSAVVRIKIMNAVEEIMLGNESDGERSGRVSGAVVLHQLPGSDCKLAGG